MYSNDSFLTLSPLGRIGVGSISLALTLLVLWLGWCLMKDRPWPLRLLIAFVLFYGFVWLAPQVYYAFYIFYFDDVFWQLVIQLPPSPQDIFQLLTFTGTSNLSLHSQGLLGWALILLSAIRPRLNPSSTESI